ncbi:hypothetical protein ACIBHX_19180 [Nonomuraea sp. NPDC050536]|uniref:hypothetical protein n=1 Tax=Nonomuraea sp. NPDC050536 TaxID=3364366 RepID=UPI0037CA42EC
MAAPRLISCTLALATLTLAGCTSPQLGPVGGQPTASGIAGAGASAEASAPGGEPAASPSASPLTAEAYRGELDSRRKTVLDAINAMAGARTPKALNQNVERAETALNEAADALSAVTPPAEVRPQHDSYVTSLRDLAARLGSTAGKVSGRDLCTSSAVLTDLGTPLKSLDTAGQALQGAGDYPADVVTVKSGAKQNRRLGNGAFIKSGSLTGRSYLEIDNGASRDSVVTLMRGGSKVFTVYVRRKSKFKVRGVRDGSYKIFFTHGVDWDGKTRSFTRQCSFERFQESVKFKTTYTATQIRWHDWTVTLHAITGGNAKTDDVDPDSFPK